MALSKRACLHTYAHAYTHANTCTQTYMHAHLHTHTHTHRRGRRRRPRSASLRKPPRLPKRLPLRLPPRLLPEVRTYFVSGETAGGRGGGCIRKLHAGGFAGTPEASARKTGDIFSAAQSGGVRTRGETDETFRSRFVCAHHQWCAHTERTRREKDAF